MSQNHRNPFTQYSGLVADDDEVEQDGFGTGYGLSTTSDTRPEYSNFSDAPLSNSYYPASAAHLSASSSFNGQNAANSPAWQNAAIDQAQQYQQATDPRLSFQSEDTQPGAAEQRQSVLAPGGALHQPREGKAPAKPKAPEQKEKHNKKSTEIKQTGEAKLDELRKMLPREFEGALASTGRSIAGGRTKAIAEGTMQWIRSLVRENRALRAENERLRKNLAVYEPEEE